MRKYLVLTLALLAPGIAGIAVATAADSRAGHKFGRADDVNMLGGKLHDTTGTLTLGDANQGIYTIKKGAFTLPTTSTVVSTGTTDNTDPNQNVYIGVIDPNVVTNSGPYGIYIGTEAGYDTVLPPSSGQYNICIGAYTAVNNQGGSQSRGVAVGAYAKVTDVRGTAVGPNTVAGASSVAVGRGANANTVFGVSSANTAVGFQASTATYNMSTAIGQNATSTDSHQVMMGTSAEYVMHPGGIVQGAIATKTANYTLTLFDTTVLCDATAGAVTITLPPAATSMNGRLFRVKKIDASGNTCTVKGNAAELIDGSNTYTAGMGTQYGKVTVVGNGTVWSAF